jgi:choline kinase
VYAATVEESVLAARRADVALAVDQQKTLGKEEMKILVGDGGGVRRISKNVRSEDGGWRLHIGVALIGPAAAGLLADALESTWRRDPSLYEHGVQELVAGGKRGRRSDGAARVTGVDDQAALARAEVGRRL